MFKVVNSTSIFCSPIYWRNFSSCNKLVHLVIPDRFSIPFSTHTTQLILKFRINLPSAYSSLSNQICSRSYSSSMSKPILYSYFRSSASWRVRIVLTHKGIEYEYKPINLLLKEQLGEEYLKVNAMGQVPALVYNGKIITQSMAMMDFIEDVFPQVPMLPKDPFLKAKVREICDIINSGIQPLQNLSVIVKYSDDQEKRTEWANFWISKGLDALEKVLSESSGKFCVGDEITLADSCLVPQVAAAQRFKVNIGSYPNIQRIYDSLCELEAFKNAHAFVQPDCPPDLRIG